MRDDGDVADLTGCQAFVLGGAAYIGHWRKEASIWQPLGGDPPDEQEAGRGSSGD